MKEIVINIGGAIAATSRARTGRAAELDPDIAFTLTPVRFKGEDPTQAITDYGMGLLNELEAKVNELQKTVDQWNTGNVDYTPSFIVDPEPMYELYDDLYEEADGRWIYYTMQDESVCHLCRPLHGTEYTEEELYTAFEYIEILDAYNAKPNTHMPRDDNCRCYMLWEEY